MLQKRKKNEFLNYFMMLFGRLLVAIFFLFLFFKFVSTKLHISTTYLVLFVLMQRKRAKAKERLNWDLFRLGLQQAKLKLKLKEMIKKKKKQNNIADPREMGQLSKCAYMVKIINRWQPIQRQFILIKRNEIVEYNQLKRWIEISFFLIVASFMLFFIHSFSFKCKFILFI